MSGRIRTIKPEWRESESLGSCSDAARVLSVSLVTLADDQGNGRGSIGYLAAQTWTYSRDSRETLARASAALRELVAIGYVVIYKVGGSTYFHLTGWSKHQRVDKPGKPRVPEPDSATIRESLAKVPGSLAPDHDPDHDQERDQEPDLDLPPSRRSVGKPSELPVDWSPTPEHVGLAAKLGVSLESEVAKFKAHAEANGRRQKRWNASFTGWLHNAQAFAGRGGGARGTTGGGLSPRQILELDLGGADDQA
jgi:hypothetical protein